jgi:hypothetical protein
MSQKEIVGAAEFRCVRAEDDPVDVQIDAWLQEYPQVTIVDVKYQVAPYVEAELLHFATFALVLFHEPEPPPNVNRVTTQRMQIPATPGAKPRA